LRSKKTRVIKENSIQMNYKNIIIVYFPKKENLLCLGCKKYVHTAHCVIMKEPIDINTLETFSEEENYRLNSNLYIYIYIYL